MKKRMISLLIPLTLVICAWSTGNCFNSNTWSIRINDHEILNWQKNEIGDEAKIKIKSLKQNDVLHAQRYLCGQDANNSTTTVTLKNNFGQTLKQTTSKNSSMIFEADVPLDDVLTKVSVGQTIKVYFTIKRNSKGTDDTVLLGQIKLE